MKSAVIAEITLTQSTLATRRNIQKLVSATDLTDAAKNTLTTVTLEPDNVGGDLPAAAFTVGNVESFLHIATTNPIRVTFTSSAVTVTLLVIRHMTLTAALGSVIIRNQSQSEPVIVKIISA